MELSLKINIPILCSCNELCICRDFIKCKNCCFCGNKKRRVQRRSEYCAKSPDYYIEKSIKPNKSVNFDLLLKINYYNNLETSIKIYNLIRNYNLSPRVIF
jgi:hypothetical protein